MKLYEKGQIDWENILFDNRTLFWLLLPIVIEQFLNSLMGMADTMMVSTVGSVAISAVSLVDSINNLVIQIFSAMASGATIICSQYIGSGNKKESNRAAGQVVLTVFVISFLITVFCIFGGERLLRLVFGTVEDSVMKDAWIYFMITAMSYPFLALFSAGAALYRASGNSKFPTKISVVSNFINITGNALFIYGFQWGVAAGIENGMFQFGKLAVQSTVSTMGTIAMAAAGDVKFSMIASVSIMWGCRVALGIFFVRVLGFGLVGVWIGMFVDWIVRAFIFTTRFANGKWLHYQNRWCISRSDVV